VEGASIPKFKDVDEYIARLTGWQAEAATQLRAIIREAAPDAEEAIKWSQPVCSTNGPFCYFKAFAKHIDFGFWRGKQLTDTSGLLQSGGKKVAHVSISSLDDIQPQTLKAFVRDAVALNLEQGDPTKGS
jgi:hypothetical protein